MLLSCPRASLLLFVGLTALVATGTNGQACPCLDASLEDVLDDFYDASEGVTGTLDCRSEQAEGVTQFVLTADLDPNGDYDITYRAEATQDSDVGFCQILSDQQKLDVGSAVVGSAKTSCLEALCRVSCCGHVLFFVLFRAESNFLTSPFVQLCPVGSIFCAQGEPLPTPDPTPAPVVPLCPCLDVSIEDILDDYYEDPESVTGSIDCTENHNEISLLADLTPNGDYEISYSEKDEVCSISSNQEKLDDEFDVIGDASQDLCREALCRVSLPHFLFSI